MKKKFLSFVLVICLLITCAFALTACGDDHTHSLTKVDAVAETCTTAGNTAYYKCACGKYFSDEEAKTEIEKDSWLIEEKGHSWDNGSISTPATPDKDGEITYECLCGETKTETFTYASFVSVTKEEWKKAFADAMSKTVAKTIVLFDGENTEPTKTALIKEDAFYMPGSSYEILLTTSNGKYYCYEKSNGSWSLNGNVTTEESYNSTIEYLWSNFFAYFRCNDFENATFNETDGTYIYSAVLSGSNTANYSATFMQGKLTKWIVYNNGTPYITLTFDFAEPTIEIPQV